MIEFLKLQYRLGKVTKDQLLKLVGVKITQLQYDEIVSSQ